MSLGWRPPINVVQEVVVKVRAAVLVVLLYAVVGASLLAQTIRYIYDESGRLVGVIDPAGDAAAYDYDATGNLLSITRSTSTQVKVLEFTPNAGLIGQTVTIYGTGFSATPVSNTVTFNGTSATVSSATANSLVVTVPAGATTGAVGVKDRDKSQAARI
jgi:YD repeat-containing protein